MKSNLKPNFSKFSFWVGIILPVVCGFVGYLLGSYLPIPNESYPQQPQLVYGLIGVAIGLVTYPKVASWLIKTSTRIVANIMSRLATEIVNQFGQIRGNQMRFRRLTSFPAQFMHSDNISQMAEITSQKLVKPKVLIIDTSSLIDGRILDVAKTGFLDGVFLIPNFVLKELQQVADSSDSLKRSRGRRGFEILEALKKLDGIKYMVWEKEVSGKVVDDKLIRLGKTTKGKIITCDFNLNKVATLSGVPVLNLNELANSLKMITLPGEKMEIKIVQKGKDVKQGVGYLEDGTMVVVEDGSKRVGEMISVEATKTIQNPAGRIIFGRVAN